MKNQIESAAIAPIKESFSLAPANLTEAMKFAELMSKSDLVPKDFKGQPANILIAVQIGAELSIPPMQSLSNIAVINGRACIWGDLFLAIIQGSPLYESHKEYFDHEKSMAVCEMKRRGNPDPFISTFSVDDAKKAKLWGKAGPWTSYPKRMMQFRARGFCGRDAFSDVLKGIALREEVEDYEIIDAPQQAAPALPMPQRMSTRQEVETEPIDVAEFIGETPPDDVPWPEDPLAGKEQEPATASEDLRVESVGDAVCGKKNGRQWERTEVIFNDGSSFNTFSPTVAEAAREALDNCRPVHAEFEKKGDYENLVALEIVE